MGIEARSPLEIPYKLTYLRLVSIMTVALRSPHSPEKVRPRQDIPRRGNKVTSLAKHQRTPTWLKTLFQVHSLCSVTTFVLAFVALTLYGNTVYSQQQWGQQYRELEKLRHQERQLMAAREALKNQIARQAEDPSSGLVPPSAELTLVLEPTPKRDALAPQPTEADAQREPTSSKPVGY
ncbi:MAG: hypothetical protein D6680_12725 [Cyanobacteria bacterium J007]|nr:MAG: hypothetical protein D6680_12725 [Cyanobacteria bacterium J007]